MKFPRVFTTADLKVEDQISWKIADSKITTTDGTIIFEMKGIEVPSHWSQTAVDILAQKYLRKAGVPDRRVVVFEEGLPQWLLRCKPATAATLGAETSAKGVFNRLAGCWTYHGWKEGIFRRANGTSSEEDASAFYDEIYYTLAMQFAAPNSPQFFNTGLWWAYGIQGSPNGQWYVEKDGSTYLTANSYAHPQPHACFIQPVADDLVNEGGIMDLWTREVRLFKHGSGTGTNFSKIRAKGERLSGGGVSSGLMSFLKIGDVAAGAIKSGGTTRRAAKMCILDLDHPEIEDFIWWKVEEERKARYLIKAGYLEEDALSTVSGQNANNSVRATDEFLLAVDKQLTWYLTNRIDGSPNKNLCAAELWDDICVAAWQCGDPGLHFQDTVNAWHTCKNDGEINASNPCSEYLFLDNTACNLASLNLVLFLKDNGEFDLPKFIHAVRLWIVVLEISVYMASFPSAEIAKGSYNYRTLGLGYANLGGLLMRSAIPYDSAEGRNRAANITALLQGVAYKTSAEMATELGPFPRWMFNRDCMADVVEKHYNCVCELIPLNEKWSEAVEDAWTFDAVKTGFRNAQVTLLAPTGTIALLMDCDTTGIEPDFSLVKHKRLAGGGDMTIVNQSVIFALQRLGYSEEDRQSITMHIVNTGSIFGSCIRKDHESIFATAVGENALSPEAHVKMVAAVQPFLSGGVSKTVNMPNSATVEDISNIYRLAHKLGLKSISVYRDGCKLAQPLSSGISVERDPLNAKIDDRVRGIAEFEEALRSIEDRGVRLPPSDKDDPWIDELGQLWENPKNIVYVASRGERHPLPARRKGYTQKVRIGGMSLYLRTGEYEDGVLGEIWASLGKEGSTLKAVMEAWAKSISIGMQFGVPLSEFVDSFLHTQFEPAGVVTGHDRIKFCTSIIDFIFRDLALTYLDRQDLAHNTRPAEAQKKTSAGAEANKWKDPSGKFIDPDAYITGWSCPECGGLMLQTGTCHTCSVCSYNTGCS